MPTSAKAWWDREGCVINGQKIQTSRAEHSDLMLLLARSTHREHAAGRTDGRSAVLIDLRGHLRTGITVGTRRSMRNHATTEVCFDNLAVPATELDRGRGQGVPPDPDADGFGTHPDRRRGYR